MCNILLRRLGVKIGNVTHVAARNKEENNVMKKSVLFLFALGCVAILLEGPPASALPYDPYPWCAQYSGDGGGGENCGFLTIQQCRATVSGIGGFCVPNQFYSPRGGRSARYRYRYVPSLGASRRRTHL